MQCLNATTPLTSIYLKNQNFKDININLASQEKPHIQEDGDGWITVNSHLPNKSKKNKGKKDKEKNESSSTTIDTANINKKFQDFLVEGRRSKNKCYDPSPLFKSISNMFINILFIFSEHNFFKITVDLQGSEDMLNKMPKSF